jgi:ubiquitin-conjugating enzyme E2 O
LIPIHSPNDHEFFPEQYVVDKVTHDVDDSAEPKRVGLVRSVNSKDRTASVSWFKPTLHPEEPKEIESHEIVSAYELDIHPDYDYCYGDVVVRLPSVSPLIESTNSEDKMELDKKLDSSEGLAASNVAPPDASADEQVSQKEPCSQFTSLSWAGNIVGFQDGEIEVIWGDGSTSKVFHSSQVHETLIYVNYSIRSFLLGSTAAGCLSTSFCLVNLELEACNHFLIPPHLSLT